jgi:uncharacterized membrane protein
MQNTARYGASAVERFSQPREPLNAGRRIGYVLGGSALLLIGMRRLPSGLLPAALGLGVIAHGIAPGAELRSMLGIKRDSSHGADRNLTVLRSITINRPVDDLFAFLCCTEHLSTYLPDIEQVDEVDDTTWRWHYRQPDGSAGACDTPVELDQANHSLAWWSLPDAPFQQEGQIHVRPAPGRRGAEVTVLLSYANPGGALGTLVSALSEHEPSILLSQGLHRLKQHLETGQITTIDGQTSARDEQTAPEQHFKRPKDKVQIASEASFPASDAPAWMAGSAIPEGPE